MAGGDELTAGAIVKAIQEGLIEAHCRGERAQMRIDLSHKMFNALVRFRACERCSTGCRLRDTLRS